MFADCPLAVWDERLAADACDRHESSKDLPAGFQKDWETLNNLNYSKRSIHLVRVAASSKVNVEK